MEIIWTETSLESNRKILEYIKEKWTQKELVDYFNAVEKAKKNIIDHNDIGLKVSKTNIRKYLVVNNVSLFYRIDKEKLYLLYFFDNRSDPKILEEFFF